MKTAFTSDIDIDFGNREDILSLIQHTPSTMRNVVPIRRHNTGIHVTDIPYDPINDIAAIDYTDAEKRGYVKLDFLNVWVYKHVKDEQHLQSLMREPKWDNLWERNFVEKLIHLGNHYDTLMKMAEPVNSIPRMAMFLSLIRPGKRHLIGKPWAEISKTIWEKDDGGYSFKKSHSVAYANLVVLHMNLLEEDSTAFSSQE